MAFAMIFFTMIFCLTLKNIWFIINFNITENVDFLINVCWNFCLFLNFFTIRNFCYLGNQYFFNDKIFFWSLILFLFFEHWFKFKDLYVFKTLFQFDDVFWIMIFKLVSNIAHFFELFKMKSFFVWKLALLFFIKSDDSILQFMFQFWRQFAKTLITAVNNNLNDTLLLSDFLSMFVFF